MNYKLKIDNQIFDVEVGNLAERPIKTKVNGEYIEVWLETSSPYTTAQLKQESSLQSTLHTDHKATVAMVRSSEQNSIHVQQPRISPEHQDTVTSIKAPIPGVITAILIQTGAEVVVGQELCKLEAMKMNNSIRSTKVGKISKIHVSIGEHVKHNDVLFDFG